MTIYRSEEMGLYQVILRHESAFECVSELGELGLVEFEDMNPDLNSFQRYFVREVRRCDETESKIRYIDEMLTNENISTRDLYIPETPYLKQIDQVEIVLEKYVSDLHDHAENIGKMKRNLVRMKELTHVLTTIHEFFKEIDPRKNSHRYGDESNSRMEQGALPKYWEGVSSMKLNFMVGVIVREKVSSFERVLWRLCRGNALVRIYPISAKLKDDYSSEEVYKNVFIIFFQGESALMSKIHKLCDGYRTTVYKVPEMSKERKILAAQTRVSMHDLTRIILKTEAQRYQTLVSASKDITRWALMVRKMKAVYHTMNMFSSNMSKSSLIGKCWIPIADLSKVQGALHQGIVRSGTLIPVILNPQEANAEPPTYNRTNKFTAGFQALVDSYGVASYREINPALFTTITFPFIFGIMFGDVGHGLIMTLFAAWMVKMEKTFMENRASSEIWKIFFGGRYIILLMGLFSMYTGSIYNDIFSKSADIFGSSWSVNYNVSTIFREPEMFLDPASDDYVRHPYPFGVDPVWQISRNQITFVNSYKMKISIIIGFLQMFAGVLLSIGNYIYFKKFINIFCEFIPQIIFLTCMFGYLVFLMFFKWFAYAPHNPTEKGPGCAPLILITFINMVMFKSGTAEPPCSPFMYSHQHTVERVLVFVIMVCVPWMLLLKPFLIIRRHKSRLNAFLHEQEEKRRMTREEVMREKKRIAATRRKSHVDALKNADASDEGRIEMLEIEELEHSFNFNVFDDSHANKPGMMPRKSISMVMDLSMINDDEDDDEPSMASELPEADEGHGEIFIHQAIHTIEFVLGSVSHTASYLRLWALSLAHQQLSDVLWSMILQKVLRGGGMYWGGAMVYFAFAVWATLTVSVLVLMEGLSAFLHTLRLHWVEFQSKFYSGLGHRFAPFAFPTVLAKLDAERYGH